MRVTYLDKGSLRGGRPSLQPSGEREAQTPRWSMERPRRRPTSFTLPALFPNPAERPLGSPCPAEETLPFAFSGRQYPRRAARFSGHCCGHRTFTQDENSVRCCRGRGVSAETTEGRRENCPPPPCKPKQKEESPIPPGKGRRTGKWDEGRAHVSRRK